MSVLHQGRTLDLTSTLDELTDMLRPGGSLHDKSGTETAVILTSLAARKTVLVDLTKLVAFEVASPSEGSDDTCGWVGTYGFHLTAVVARFEQILDSVDALVTLHKAGAYRAGWAVLEQAGQSLERLLMLTETGGSAWDDARRSGRSWGTFTAALAEVDGITGFDPSPFDTWHTDADDEDVAGTAMVGASDPAARLVGAVRLGADLARVHLPAHLQMNPWSGPYPGHGLGSEAMVGTQFELACAVVCAAAAAVKSVVHTREAFDGYE